ncbi:hypothetical protein NE237_011256 [Protea cynaroides]|uniref:Uncharacterized protein n=1 Tax=Protea cynaroides TaxID=273540 RepID=A0A9Q0GXL5_9MAGN|nr:hypothetical protein NE237_011256 [Protea cynaroides]
MGDPISLIYVYGNYFEDKTVDPERYGYIDVVYDAYSMVSNNIGDISNSSVTIQGCGRDYVQRRRELTRGASSSMTNTHLVNLSSDENYDSDDHPIDEQVRDEAVREEEVGDDDSTDSEKDFEGDEDMGGVVESDGKLSDCKSNDSPDEIDW